MSDAPPASRKKLVFLHIPKTAGQTVRRELRRAFGRAAESPVKITAHAQAFGTCFPEPDRYDLFQGHLDWHDLDQRIAPPRRVFTILREPRERIASLYFYQLAYARARPAAELETRLLQLIGGISPDDFFANPDLEIRVNVDRAYDNFQTGYLATKRIHRGRGEPERETLLATALANARTLDLVCTIDRLDRVEAMVRTEFGRDIALTTTFANRGDIDPGKSRYGELAARIKNKRTLDRIAEFGALDERLIRELDLA